MNPMKTTDNELHKLGAWIAEHVMGFSKAKALDGMGPNEFYVQASGVVWARTDHGYDNYEPYECMSDAMQVLEKCRKKTVVAISTSQNGKCLIGPLKLEAFGGIMGYAAPEFCFEADTLPLAICLLAEQLFSK